MRGVFQNLRRADLVDYRRWLASGPLAGFNSLVVLATIGIIVELYGDSFPGWVKVPIVGIVIVLSASVLYVQFYRPAVDSAEEYQEKLMAVLFLVIISRYKMEHPGEYLLRANVMKIRRKRWGYARFLKIDCWAGSYSVE